MFSGVVGRGRGLIEVVIPCLCGSVSLWWLLRVA